MSIGISAAAVRINREEKEKGKSTAQTFESVKRRWALAMGGDEKSSVDGGNVKREG